MRKPVAASLSRPAMLCAALALGTSCKSVEPHTTPSDGTTAPPEVSTPAPVTETATEAEAEAEAPTRRGNSLWLNARVGDRVAYSFSANRKAMGRQAPGTVPSAAVAGVVTLEVSAVELPWVWVTLYFTEDGGAPSRQPLLARPLVMPVRADESRALDAPREGRQSTEQLAAAGRQWEAKRYLNDKRSFDGPLENRLYAATPGPLYLTNGLLDASTTLSGFGTGGGSQLTLVEARQGQEGGTGLPPTLARPWGPGTWFDVQVGEDTPSVMRTCQAAERGFLLRQQVTPSKTGAACPDFTQADAVPLEEAVLARIWESLDVRQWPPSPTGLAPARSETVAVGAHRVPALRFETPQPQMNNVQVQVYAADPWDEALSGLAHEARFQPLLDQLMPAGGGMQLLDWGVWVPGGTP
ncbi:DUF6068 family protein [Corallococcus macrosporus]|uniref:Lipoprotein n=1 Tax=Myxococcus fulvus (strain ATCC BAA-855 / HW-1) TaxID=483219 RepID=F8CQY2_MYXFH|nr:DUF6068 family protein [Corallococcus macrosporus]AEI63026.1 hypothetical protein LILAB_05525 [Corallococcus macrosporus]